MDETLESVARSLAYHIEEITKRDEPYIDKLAAVMEHCDKAAFEEFASWFSGDDEEEDDEC